MEDCIFCKIAAKEIHSSVVYEDEDVFAFSDIHPQAPVHILVIPREHIPTLDDVKDFSVYGKVYKAIDKIVGDKGLKTTGYRVVANCKHDSGQEVYHIHFHILGGRPMKWPPG